MTWIEDLGAYLQTNNIGTLGTNIFYNGFEASASNCIALFEQAGTQEDITATGDETIRYPELGVRVRNTSLSAAREKAYSIYSLLHNISNSQIGNTFFISIEAVADPFYVSQSKTDLFIFSINFSMEIQGT